CIRCIISELGPKASYLVEQLIATCKRIRRTFDIIREYRIYRPISIEVLVHQLNRLLVARAELGVQSKIPDNQILITIIVKIATHNSRPESLQRPIEIATGRLL